MTDLRSRLHDVVDGPGTPGDGAAATGATALDDALVGTLTARVRRRRAVRTGATGALGALTVAAVAVGATALTGGRGSEPGPAGTTRPDGDAPLSLDCGERVDVGAVQRENGDMVLGDPEVLTSSVGEGDLLDVRLRLRNDGDRDRTWDTQQVVQLAALQDSTVVATAVVPIHDVGGAGVRTTWTDAVVLRPCDATEATDALAYGNYELVASAVLADADGSDAVPLSSGPVPFRVVPASLDDPRLEDEARAALAEVVAAAESAREDAAVGTCGTRIPTTTDPYLGLGIEVGSPIAPGSPLDGTGSVSTRDGLTVVGDASITGVRLVLTRDRVVVGLGEYDPAFVNRLTFAPGGSLELPAVGDAVLCRLPGDDGRTLPLPAGAYQAYGLYQVAVTEVEQVGGGSVDVAAVVTGTRTVVSAPVDVAIDGELG